MNTVSSPTMQAAQNVVATGVGGGSAPVTGDAFSMILQQLSEGSLGDFSQMFTLMNQMKQQQTEDGSLMGSEMMAQLFAQGSPLWMQMVDPTAAAQLSELTAGSSAPMNANSVLLSLLDSPLLKGQPGTAQILQQMVQESTPATQQQSLFTQQQATQTAAPQIPMQLVSTPQSQTDGQLTQQSSMQFYSAVAQAKQDLQTNASMPRDDKNQVRLDIEQLQQEVDSGKFTGTLESQKLSGDKALNQADVLSQVKTGISQNIGSGKNEFVIKLKPDGLGEITVEMTKTEDKISMRIIASSSEVAKLLDSSLNDLRNMLRPLGAEVREVAQQPTVPTNERQTFSFAGQQQFSEQQQQQQQFSGNHRHSSTAPVTFDNLLLDPEQEEDPTLLNSNLSIYI